MNVAIVGYGIVGKATHHSVLNNDPSVDIYDLDRPYPEQPPGHDVIFICVPTGNDQDIACLAEMCHKIFTGFHDAHICIRSTIPIGFASRGLSSYGARISYFPEFLRERYWLEDSSRATWVIGCADPSQPVLQNIFGTRQPVYLALAETEILKLMHNVHSAMQVVFANHIYDISKIVQADYHIIETLFDKVHHHGQNYLKVAPDLRGFGGKCLPKDLDFLISSFEKYQVTQTLFSSIKDDNEKWPTTVRKDR